MKDIENIIKSGLNEVEYTDRTRPMLYDLPKWYNDLETQLPKDDTNDLDLSVNLGQQNMGVREDARNKINAVFLHNIKTPYLHGEMRY